MERQPTEWGKKYLPVIYQIRDSYAGHIKNCTSQQYKNQEPNIKWIKTFKNVHTHFSAEDVHVARKHAKRRSTSLVSREMRIKTTVRYHATPTGPATINLKRKQKISVGEGVKKLDRSRCAGRNVTWRSHFGEQLGCSSKGQT